MKAILKWPIAVIALETCLALCSVPVSFNPITLTVELGVKLKDSKQCTKYRYDLLINLLTWWPVIYQNGQGCMLYCLHLDNLINSNQSYRFLYDCATAISIFGWEPIILSEKKLFQIFILPTQISKKQPTLKCHQNLFS